MKRYILLILCVLFVFPAFCADEKDTVAILVDSMLYKHIETELEAYMESVEAEFPVELLLYHDHDWKNKSFRETRDSLVDIWETEHIDGAILVGFFPMMLYQVEGQGIFPMVQAMGYEDLDGDFEDRGTFMSTDEGDVFIEGQKDQMIFRDAHGRERHFNDTIYDHHIWNENVDYSDAEDVAQKVQADIWCAFMRPYQPAYNDLSYNDDVVAQMKDYLNRCARYSRKQLPYSRRGFVQSSSDWGGDVPTIGNILKEVYGEEDTRMYKPPVSGIGYLRERAIGMEVAYYYAHSSSWFHQNDRAPYGSISKDEICSANGPGALATMGFNCHGADFLETPEGCIGQHYVFEGNGMTFIGNTISTGFPSFPSLARKMTDGKYLAQAFLEVINESYQSSAKPGGAVTWNQLWGNTIIGNPFIYACPEKDMSFAGARVTGEVSNGDDLFLTFYKGSNIYTTSGTKDGIIDVSKLDTGKYDVTIETVNGELLDQKTLNVSSVGEQIQNWDISVPSAYSAKVQSYYLKVRTTKDLPEDWRDEGADLSKWNKTDAEIIGEYVSDYPLFSSLYIKNPKGMVFVRKHFTINNLKAGERVYLYSAQNPSIYVNGAAATLADDIEDRNKFSYFQSVYDITDDLQEGVNYFVARVNDILQISDPVYISSGEPVTTIPESPVELTAVAQEGNSITLQWTDNSDNEDGFIVERRGDDGDFDTIAFVGRNVVNYENTELDIERYTYRIAAFNYAGKSQFSNEEFCSLTNMKLLENDNGLVIYPNPVSSVLTIESPFSEVSEIKVYNVLGRIVAKTTLQPKECKRIDLSDYSEGIYMFVIDHSDNRTVKRIVVN